jgi:hypothetical protein
MKGNRPEAKQPLRLRKEYEQTDWAERIVGPDGTVVPDFVKDSSGGSGSRWAVIVNGLCLNGAYFQV